MMYESYNDYALTKSYDHLWYDSLRTENILCDVDEFFIIKSSNYTEKNLHHLAITKLNVTCLRDLNNTHINMLKNMQQKCFELLKKVYNVNDDNIRAYVHYPPSKYVFHVHFDLIGSNQTPIEYTHDLTQITHNLSFDNYYREIILRLLVD